MNNLASARTRVTRRLSGCAFSMWIPAAAFIVATIASPLQAQSAQRWSIQGSLIYVTVSGEAYEGMNAGAGLELQLRYTPSQLSIGAGIQSSSHSVQYEELGDQEVSLTGGFVEPRYVIDIGSDRAAPYVSGRLAFLKQSITVEGLTGSTSGTQLNGGGGVLVRVSPRVNLDFGVTFGSIKFGDITLTDGIDSVTLPGSSAGTNVVFRAGIAVGLW